MPVYSGIGVYSAYAEDDTHEGDEVSSTYEGRHLTFLGSDLIGPNALIQKGDPVVVASGRGDIVGVAFQTQVLAGDRIAIDTEGIWMLEVLAEDDWGGVAVVAGDPLFIDTTDLSCVISKIQDPESNTLFGYALGNIDSGQTAVIAVKVHWGPSLDHIWMGILTNYTESVTGKPRQQIDSDYTGTSGIHIASQITARLNPATTTAASLYGIRAIADLVTGKEMTDGNMHGVHGYARVFGTLNGGGLGGVRVAGLKGEVYSDGATLTACDFIAGVMAFATLHVRPTAGVYAAFIAYSASGAIYPDAMYYGYGRFNNGIDLTGWNAGDAGENHALCLTASRGYSVTGGNTGVDACIANIRVRIAGVTGFVAVRAAAV